MNLERLIPFYRRDSTEPTGAVRISAVATIGTKQMPGGRAQISARTLSGEQQYLSPQLPNFNDALVLLEKFRLFCGGELDRNPAEEWVAARNKVTYLAEIADEQARSAEESAHRASAASEVVWSPPVGAFT